MDINHLKHKFIDEAESLLTNLDNVLILLEKDTSNMKYIEEAFRVMHTIKGASGMFGFDKIVEITHEIESLYDMVRDQKLNVSSTLLEITFASADHIRALLSDEMAVKDENNKRHTLLKDNITLVKSGVEVVTIYKNLQNEEITADTNILTTWNIFFYPSDDLIKRCINITYTFHDLFLLGDYKISSQPFELENEQFWSIFLITAKPYDDIETALMFVLDYCKIIKLANFNIFDPAAYEIIDKKSPNQDITEENPAIKPLIIPEGKGLEVKQNLLEGMNSLKTSTPSVVAKITTSRINVDAKKLDTLMYLVSELVTTKSELNLALQNKHDTKSLEAAEKIEKLSKLFSENALSIRLVSLQEMLNKFKRLIRDLSKQLGKNIDFVIVGEDTELDKNIIDAIGEPIMHIIRNNIDHGIEIPEKRLERGKAENGIIHFEAYKSGNYVYITISDDGNGIDTNFVYNKAVENGFIPAGTKLTQKEIFDLIFLPGFSTAQSLTNVSGRGVGMDIVIKKIQEIRGEISVDSEKGRGTAFTIKLQQTIAIIDTLLISVGNFIYAIPIEDVEACGLEAHENIVNNQSNLIAFENELIPFINLREEFSTDHYSPENEKLIIVNKKNKRYAIIADTIIGEFQAVIKPLGETFRDIEFLSGASLLGDGSIALLIDTDKLTQLLVVQHASI